MKPVCYDVLPHWFLLNKEPQRHMVGCLVLVLPGTQNCKFCKKEASLEESVGKRKKTEATDVPDSFPFPLVKIHLTESQLLKLPGFSCKSESGGENSTGSVLIKKENERTCANLKSDLTFVSPQRQGHCRLCSFLMCTNCKVSCLSICIPKL